jgi:P4 family phage/plasmid primase-like protien
MNQLKNNRKRNPALDNYYDHPISTFLKQHYTESSKDCTMTGMDDLKGKWIIPDKDYPRLLELLNDFLFVKGNRALGFVERPRPGASKPFLIDLDFAYTKTQALERRFTESDIRNFCERIVDACEHFFDLKKAYESLQFFITLRPSPYDDKDITKDGIHICCPTLTMVNEKWNVIRSYLMNQNVISEVFGHTQYSNSDDAIFDKKMGTDQGWMFYGASKSKAPAYKLKYVWTYHPEAAMWEDENPESYAPSHLLKLLSIRYEIEDDINEVKEEALAEYQALTASLNKPFVQTEPDPSTANLAAALMAVNNPLVNAFASMLPQTEDQMNTLRLIVDCLSPQRADDRESWIRVGWCLHNINASEEMFDLWMEFSKKSPKFRDIDIPQYRREWMSGMRKSGDARLLREPSLHKWARDDNHEKYKQILDKDISEYIIRQTDATHYHIALLMQKMFGSLYIASTHQRDTEWYYYDESLNMWRHLNQGIELRQKICTDVANRIQDACTIVGKQFSACNEPGTKKLLAEKQSMLHEMQMKLYSYSFSSSVMSMCAQLFYEQDFENKLNINPYLLGCANGILDLRMKGPHDTREHVVFRQGRPEDYVSFLAGRNHPETDAINYAPYNARDPVQKEIQEFLAKLFPREELRKYVLRLLASCLEGENREQQYYFWIGVGSNGKSKLNNLMRLVLGDYWTKLATTALTRKRPESGAANPDIIAMKCRRFIVSEEPDDKEPLNTSRMKQMSGEDLVEARGLYKDQEKFKIMGKMCMLCNRLPTVNALDNGTWRRIRVIPFESRFEDVNHPDVVAKKPNFFPRDNSLDQKLMEWREPFLSLLVYIYETEYIQHGLHPEPDIVKQESEKYRADYDNFAKFRMERIREQRNGYTEVLNNVVASKEIWKCYKHWTEETSSKRMDLKELIQRCEDTFGDSKGKNVYSHIRVFETEEEIQEFDQEHEQMVNGTSPTIEDD